MQILISSTRYIYREKKILCHYSSCDIPVALISYCGTAPFFLPHQAYKNAFMSSDMTELIKEIGGEVLAFDCKCFKMLIS
jgi:hypothetical protein